MPTDARALVPAEDTLTALLACQYSQAVLPAVPTERRDELRLECVWGERVSLQIACRTDDTPAAVSARVETCDGIRVRVRRAGLAPVTHVNTEIPKAEIDVIGYIPGYVPDPLLPETTTFVGQWELTNFWVTIDVDVTVAPGEHRLRATISTEAGDLTPMTIVLHVHPAILANRTDFPVTHWLYADAIADRHRVDPFGEPSSSSPPSSGTSGQTVCTSSVSSTWSAGRGFNCDPSAVAGQAPRMTIKAVGSVSDLVQPGRLDGASGIGGADVLGPIRHGGGCPLAFGW